MNLFESSVDKVIVGLGNPGKNYSWTRHNIGSQIIESIVQEKSIELEARGGVSSKIAVIEIATQRVLVAVPQTFMNLSGEAVLKIVEKSRIKNSLQKLLIVYDDIETLFGLQAIAFNGGARGHNGIRSIHNILKTKEFYQFRFGVGRPQSGQIAEYVLDRFSIDEMDRLSHSLIANAKELIYKWVVETTADLKE